MYLLHVYVLLKHMPLFNSYLKVHFSQHLQHSPVVTPNNTVQRSRGFATVVGYWRDCTWPASDNWWHLTRLVQLAYILTYQIYKRCITSFVLLQLQLALIRSVNSSSLRTSKDDFLLVLEHWSEYKILSYILLYISCALPRRCWYASLVDLRWSAYLWLLFPLVVFSIISSSLHI